MDTKTLSDIIEGVFIGFVLFVILIWVCYLVGSLLIHGIISFFYWYDENQYLRKRNNHRRKVGLPPLKSNPNE